MNFIQRSVISVLLSLAFSITMSAQKDYFPKGTFGADPAIHYSWADRYSKYLKALREPSLSSRPKSGLPESYRFLWLRTFHKPLSVRFDIGSDGIAILTVKMTNGTGGSDPGRLVENRTRRLTKQQTDRFVDQVNSVGFWELVTHEDSVDSGPDGSQWIIEGTKDGKYHVVDRWSPKGGPIRTLGLALAMDLGQMKIPSKEIY